MNFTLIGISVSLVPLVCIAIAIGWGFLIGTRNARIRMIGVGVSFIAALVTAICVKHIQYAEIAGIVESLMAANGQLEEIMTLMQSAATLMQDMTAVVVAFVAPLVFTLSFIVYSIITWIIGWIVSLVIALVKYGSEKKPRRAAEIITYATVQVLLTAFVLMIPVIAYLSIMPGVIDAGVEFELIEKDSDAFEMIEAVENAPLTKVTGFLGGNALSKALTSFEVGEVKTDLATEVDAISGFAGNVRIITGAKLSTYGDKEIEAIRNLSSDFDNSALIPAVVGEVVYIVTDGWLDEEGDGVVLGIKKPAFTEATAEMFEEAFDHILEALFADSHNYDALREDFDTMANVFGILASDGIFADMGKDDTGALITKLSSGSTVKELVSEFGRNPSFKVLIGDVSNIGMKAIGTTLNIPENADAVYNKFNSEIASGINNVKNGEYSDEDKKAELADTIKSAFANSGNSLSVDDSVFGLYAEALLQDFSEYESVTADDVSEFFGVFAIVSESGDPSKELASGKNGMMLLGTESVDTSEYTNPVYSGKTVEQLAKESAAGMLANILNGIVKASQESENDEIFQTKVKEVVKTSYEEYAEATGKDASLADELAETLSVSVTSVTEESIAKTASMQSSETFGDVTVIVTLDELLVDPEEAANSIESEEDILKEAEAIQNIFEGASQIVVKLNDSNSNSEGTSVLKEIAEDLGIVLDNLETTSSVGSDKTSSLVIAIFQSETVRDTADLDIDSATELADAATKENEDGTQSSYAETMGSVATGAAIADKLNQEDSEITEDDIRELLEDMTPKTAEMLKVYMTEKRVQGFGVPEAKAPIATELIGNLLTEMGCKDKYIDTYDAETKGVLKMFNLITAAKHNTDSSSALFNRDGVEGKMKVTAAELVDSMMGSGMVCEALAKTREAHGGELDDPFGVNISEDSADYLDLKTALEDYYKNHSGDDVREKIDTVANFFGVSNIEYNS